jgi:hypothetical protein
MADYFAFPLWVADGRSSMLAPEQLPLSAALRDDLVSWARTYDETLMGNDYEWPSTAVMQTWTKHGRALACRVRDELGDAYEVVYFNEETDEIETA